MEQIPFIFNSMHLAEWLRTLELPPPPLDILFGFERRFLFTNVSTLDNSLARIKQIFADNYKPIDFVKLKHVNVLDDRFFLFRSSYYEQVFVNIFMQAFETTHLLKPKCWFHDVVDIFLVWLTSTKFIIQIESSDELPFIGVLAKQQSDGRLDHLHPCQFQRFPPKSNPNVISSKYPCLTCTVSMW